ncbi:hypothetical protein [uncultured Draconibacterium sp.]|nr:hypothetical protein [uncultured Draconibacterium sp.]
MAAAHQQHENQSLAELMDAKIQEIGMPAEPEEIIYQKTPLLHWILMKV